MARYPIDRYEHPGLPAALRQLRTRAGLSRAQVAARAQGQVSAVYLAQCESATRTPSKAKLDVMLQALGSNRAEFEALLAARVDEGAEWDAVPAALWDRGRDELLALYDAASGAQRAELLAFARRLAP
ncbi:helix-turn-helix domain-containing protein [Solirubrobacter sp. CPCC 204708]|uniref:Helix-turn-helix domain-containing protein n=1 Tax=Solirubrobacter deserti TaxID=2282478 RepID=A0ABT4RNA6_9ACTN|nr:helix-turn-helix transcriptional regulator [Solirubrobacter deserti]MBE2317470.1 helix-turn-helix domain-containing protein [Solirubrobacter deserti]MDA0140052.1 helix-turn-helix domain-containing protein [Solirubrobacter deserti]